MMNVKLVKRDHEAEVYLEGRINANTATELDEYFQDIASRFDKVVLDFEKVPYISSFGLRALRNLYVALNKKGGSFVIRNVRKEIMDVFHATGFSMLLDFV